MRQSSALPALFLALLTSGTSPRAQSPALIAQDAWIRAIPGSEVAAVYVTLHNGSTYTISIVGVRSSRARQAMIHESSLVNGQSRMRPHEQLSLGPGETLRLAPGGLHIMLQGLTRPLSSLEEVPVELLLGGGGSVPLAARVRAPGVE
ncbi:MAG: copper chaperone PCu(A)C [Gammaproteobacteria bacterium]|nr:copper chaperone PCu(A)C [Gammaproteobacteria bacterium]